MHYIIISSMKNLYIIYFKKVVKNMFWHFFFPFFFAEQYRNMICEYDLNNFLYDFR